MSKKKARLAHKAIISYLLECLKDMESDPDVFEFKRIEIDLRNFTDNPDGEISDESLAQLRGKILSPQCHFVAAYGSFAGFGMFDAVKWWDNNCMISVGVNPAFLQLKDKTLLELLEGGIELGHLRKVLRD